MTPELLEGVAALVACWTGARGDAIPRDALARAVRAELAAGATRDDLLAPDPARARRLAAAAAVGETYFFRHPEHFELVAEEVVPRFLARGGETFQAWSAGCATGEEAYSLAATLLRGLPPERVRVLGTDLVEAHVEAARRGEYGAWSCRGVAPADALRPAGGGRVTVAPAVRARARFEVHNLLWPAPVAAGSQDLVLCRNVLVYLSPDAVGAVLASLADALAPGGVLVVGTVDALGDVPDGLERFGPASVQAYARLDRRRRPPSARARRPAPGARIRAPDAPAATPVPAACPADEAVAAHVEALEALERGALAEADAVLEALARRRPEYVPATLERGLLAARLGRAEAAEALMREVLRRFEGRADAEPVAGPEPLSVGYYRAGARAFLLRGGA